MATNNSFVYVVATVICVLSIAAPAWLARVCPMSSSETTPAKVPNKVFGIVWTALYTLMAVSLFILLTSFARTGRPHPWTKFAIFLALVGYIINYAYIYTAGCKKDKTLARYALIGSAVFLPLQILATFEVSAVAGILLAPTFGWVAYAATLFERDF